MANIGICALCRMERTRQQSHIFPEWLYDDLYDDLHGYRVQSTAQNANSPRRRKGVYERLLCPECDQCRLGRLDDYAAKVFKGGVEIEVTDKPSCLIVSNLNYATFKLWQMSLLWRCGISRRPEFEATCLGPHVEPLRRCLLEQRAGQPHEYGCTVVLPASHQVMRQVIYPPEPITICGHRCYRASFGALWWFFVASSHSAAFPFQEGFLHEEPGRPNSPEQIPSGSGVLSIFKENTHSSNFTLKLGRELGAFGASNLPREDTFELPRESTLPEYPTDDWLLRLFQKR